MLSSGSKHFCVVAYYYYCVYPISDGLLIAEHYSASLYFTLEAHCYLY